MPAGAYHPDVLGAALGGLLRMPKPIDLSHMAMPRVTVARAPARLRNLLAPRPVLFDEAVKDADRVTVCVTVFALLELYKRGEAAWEQDEPFGEITVHAPERRARASQAGVNAPRSRRSSRRCSSSRPTRSRRGARRRAADLRGGGHAGGARSSRPISRKAAAWCSCASPAGSRWRRHPDAEEAARRLLSRPRTPALTPAQAETLAIVAYLQPVSRPEVARIRGVASESATSALADRGLIEEAGRSQFGAVLYRTTPLFLKLFGLDTPEDLPDPAQWDPSPEEAAALRDRLLRAGEARGAAA